MYKYAKFTLLTLAAFLLLGFSVMVNAEPPWLADKEQVIISAPLLGTNFHCLPFNMSNSPIQFTTHFIDLNGVDHSFSETIAPGETWWDQWDNKLVLTIVHCEISWTGQPGDFKASFCSIDVASYTDAVCFELF